MTKSSPNPKGKVTVIIPNWNGEKWLADCLRGLADQTFRNFEIILVDNGSEDNSIDFIRQNHPEVRLISFDGNYGFAKAVNAGIKASHSEYIALLNTDTRVRPNWLLNLVNIMKQCDPKVGCLASKMLDLSNPELIENAGDILSWHGAATKRGRGQPAKDFTNLEEIFSPCAGASLYRKSFLDELKGFDEHFFAYLEDVDLGLRGRLQGYKYLFAPSAEVLHQSHGSQMPHSRYVRLITKNRLLLFLKNIPLTLLLKHFHTLLYGQLYFLIAYRKPFSSFIGYLSCIPLIPYLFRERKKLKKTLMISKEYLNQLLEGKMNEPSLYSMLMKKVKRA